MLVDPLNNLDHESEEVCVTLHLARLQREQLTHELQESEAELSRQCFIEQAHPSILLDQPVIYPVHRDDFKPFLQDYFLLHDLESILRQLLLSKALSFLLYLHEGLLCV